MKETAAEVIADPRYRKVVSGAFLSPWFAVSLGIVVAASMTLAEPRAALSFPAGRGGSCGSASCTVPRQDQAGRVPADPSPAAAGESRLPAQAKPRSGPGQRGSTLDSGVSVRYDLLSDRRGQFMAMLVISSSETLGKWTLEFDLPNATIKAVMWGRWVYERPGVIAIEGSPSPWARSAPDQARIVIAGAGEPRWPRDCLFKAERCTFDHGVRPESKPVQGRGWAATLHGLPAKPHTLMDCFVGFRGKETRTGSRRQPRPCTSSLFGRARAYEGSARKVLIARIGGLPWLPGGNLTGQGGQFARGRA